MANAASIAITDLVPNASILPPTAQVLDTGTVAVALATAATSDMDRLFIDVTNTSTAALTVTLEAGADPPAFRQVLGDVASATMAQNVRRIFGPFESARFANAGKLFVTFTPASGTIAANFTCYRLPKV